MFPLFEYLLHFIRGQDARRITHIHQYLMKQTRFPPGALGLAAISAIDHCLWDISAKALGVPVYQLMGGHVRDKVQVYAGMYTAPDAPQARDAMDALNAQWGIKAFKLSPYRLDMHRHRWGEVVRTSAEYFRQLRETVKPEYELAFDAHAKIFEPAQAMQLGNALAPYDPLFFEEPIRPENFEAWGELKRGLHCTLATGESLYSRFEFLRLLQVRGCDIIQPDICVVGGVTEMLQINALAQAHMVSIAPHNPMGPLATAKHRERVEGYMARGCEGGAKLVTGGKRPAHAPRGYFVEPTVFGDVSNDAVIAREEIFGPVLSVIPVDSEQDAVRTANDSVYGLNASVFTHDAERAYAVARELRTGTVGHNAFRSDFSIAFGGFKQSGLGREGGVEGLLPYLESKTLVLDELPAFLRPAR